MRVKCAPDKNADNYFVAGLLFLALIALTLQGMGNTVIVVAVSLVLCVAGCLQGAVRADLWILIPLLACDAFSVVSSWNAYGAVAAGFISTQMMLTVIYMLMAHLDDGKRLFLQQLCGLWVAIVAAVSVIGFTIQAVSGHAGRLGGVLDNPNALGIFLVTGWFGIRAPNHKPRIFLRRVEPIVLSALGATLSMGSFLAMSVGLIVSFVVEVRQTGVRAAGGRMGRTLAKIALAGWVGLLLYITANAPTARWTCLVVLGALFTLPLMWLRFTVILQDTRSATKLLVVAVIIAAVTAIALRPNAAATFAERLEMMKSALGYMFMSPLLGVGPGRWQILDYGDGGIYFGTKYVHNAFLHVGAEVGVPAMVSLIFAATRFLLKRGNNKPGVAAVLTQGMMDISFFYESVPVLVVLTMARPRAGGTMLAGWTNRAVFAGIGAVFVYILLSVPQ